MRAPAITQLKIRINEPLRVAIEREAARLGVSMNALVAERLDRSFGASSSTSDSPEVGPAGTALLELFGRAIRLARVTGLSLDGDDWLNDATAYSVAARAIRYIIAELQPSGEPASLGVFPELQANELLMALGDENPERPWAARLLAMRSKMGSRLASRVIERRKSGGGLPKITAEETAKATAERSRPKTYKGEG